MSVCAWPVAARLAHSPAAADLTFFTPKDSAGVITQAAESFYDKARRKPPPPSQPPGVYINFVHLGHLKGVL